MSVNKFIGIGNVTKDPEVRYMTNGEAVANCAIACNEKWKNKAGEKQESVEFINLVFYRRLAEIAGEYLKKGSQVYVEGRITTEKWQDKEGKDRYTTKIIASEMKMLGGKRDEQSESPRQTGNARPNKPLVQTAGGFTDMDDDIPFMRLGHGAMWRVI